jgi:chemotaxis protein MotB
MWNYMSRYNLAERPARQALKALEESIREAGLEEQMDITVTEEGTRISLEGEILFTSGGATLSTQGRRFVDGVEAVIRSSEAHVRIEGHTDDVPIQTQAYPSNWELSTARAVDVLRYLVEEKGFAPARLSAEGFADTRPRVPNDTPENRARNRRVSFVLVGTVI